MMRTPLSFYPTVFLIVGAFTFSQTPKLTGHDVPCQSGSCCHNDVKAAETTGLAFDGENLWVANYVRGTVSKFREKDGKYLNDVKVGKGPFSLLYADGSIWVANENDYSTEITKIPIHTDIPEPISMGGGPGAWGSAPTNLVYDTDRHTIWIALYLDGRVREISAKDGKFIRDCPTGGKGSKPFFLAYDSRDRILWVTRSGPSDIVGIPTTPECSSGPSRTLDPRGKAPVGIAFADNSIWVALESDGGKVNELSTTGELLQSLRAGPNPYTLTVEGETLWIVISGTDKQGARGAIEEVNLKNGRSYTFPVGKAPQFLVRAGPNLWVANSGDNSVDKLRIRNGKQLATYCMANYKK